MNPHLHKYRFESCTSRIHRHIINGYLGQPIGFDSFHFHVFYGVSSYLNHTHYFSGMTGLPIKTEKGHIHKMESILEYNSGHEHKFSGYTYEDIGYISSRLAISFWR